MRLEKQKKRNVYEDMSGRDGRSEWRTGKQSDGSEVSELLGKETR